MNTHKFRLNLFTLSIAMLVFIAGCAVTDPNIETAQLNIALMDYEGAIEAADEAIEANPENGDGYFYKGVGLAQLAFTMEPSERAPQYAEARENFDRARALYEEQGVTGGEASDLPDYILDFWGQEHNMGIELISEDFVSTDQDSLILAEHHLTNAVTINPDSIQSYNILFEVNYLLDDLDAAIANAEHTIYNLGAEDLYNYYRLSFFYQQNDNFEDALTLLNQARDENPEEIEIVQELANVYLGLGDTDNALETVQSLIDSDPDNPQYRLVYGTQVYQLVLNMDEQMTEYYNEIFEINQNLRDESRQASPDAAKIQSLEERQAEITAQIDELQGEVDRFADRAEEELNYAAELEPDNPMTHATLGIIYQNRAAAKYDRRNATEDFDLAAQFDEEAQDYLRQAIPYYERAAELEPENPDNWQSLFRIYTQLGMTEEAEAAQERAGF